MKERGVLVPLVLAVGASVAYLWTLTARERELVGDLEPMRAISVAVNPIEFQYLALAAESGRLGVALRGPGDVEIHPIKLANWPSLMGGG